MFAYAMIITKIPKLKYKLVEVKIRFCTCTNQTSQLHI